MPDVFEKRIRRAEQLATEWPFATELLRFCRKVYELQRQLHQDLAATRHPAETACFPAMRNLIDLAIREGPPELAQRAEALAGTSASELSLLIGLYRQGEPMDPRLGFFPRVITEALALSPDDRGAAPENSGHQASCPICNSIPLVSVLREDKAAETVRRSLICSRCSHEWDFPRVLCPHCEEEKPEKLPRYTAQEIPWMRVEACDSCKRYIKSVDLTQNWEAEPVVDELGSTPLDVIAREHGYEKIAPNLAGI